MGGKGGEGVDDSPVHFKRFGESKRQLSRGVRAYGEESTQEKIAQERKSESVRAIESISIRELTEVCEIRVCSKRSLLSVQ